jgi:myo-inositol catabolism protein IolC
MITGYEKPLYILPFDHRHSYITGVFHWQEPLTPGQVADIVASKAVIHDGFKAAVSGHAERERAGILVDEAFGAALLQDAAARGSSRASPPKGAGRTSSTSSTATTSRGTSRR